MKKNRLLSIVMVGILSVCSCFGTLSGFAFADSNSMTVSPPYQKMILNPGEVYKNSLSVFNASNSTRDLRYSVKVGSFSYTKNEDSKDDYGSLNHINVSSYNQIMDWIKLDNEGGTVAPGQTVSVGYSINVPEDAPGGGQYATIIVVDETASGLPGQGNISIDQKFQFASIIYAEVSGETRKEGVISDNSMPSFLLNGPLTAESMVKNNGNVHTDAEYTFQVWPLFSDEELCTNEEKPETSLVLPDTEKYHAQSCDLPSFGIFKAKQTVSLFGETSIVERTVIVCPLWLLFVILFAIVALVIWIFMRVRKRKGSQKDDE